MKIIASDLDGQAGGNTGTGEVEVKVQDINDNVPFLEKNSVGGKKIFFRMLTNKRECVASSSEADV